MAPEMVTEPVVEPIVEPVSVTPVATLEVMPVNMSSPTPEATSIPTTVPTADQVALLTSNNIVTTEEAVIKPSFDCSKASNYAEKTICANQQLAKLDLQLSELYRKAKSTTNTPSELKTEQMSWLKASRRCTDETCLIQAYQTRIDALSNQ